MVANAGSREILVFGPTGAHEATIGGPGDGPGEFRTLRDLYTCRGDTLVANAFLRVNVFTSDGAFVRGASPAEGKPDVATLVSGVSADCSALLVGRAPYLGTIDVGRIGFERITLEWTTFDASASETIVTVPSREWWHRRADFTVVVPWGRLARWAAPGARLSIGVSDRPEVRVYERKRGLVRIVRWRQRPRSVTARDRELLTRRVARFAPDLPPLADVVPPLDEFPRIPEQKPLFLTLLADDEGRLWVREYPDFVAGAPGLFDGRGEFWNRIDPGGARDVWRVFGPDGRFDGVLRVPAERHILAIERGHALALETDEYDVELVRVYRIRRVAGNP